MNERIKELRKSLNLTLEKFGERLGVRKTAISKIEHGENNVSEQMFKSICREFNVSEKWLRDGDGEMFSLNPCISYKDRIIGAVTLMSDSDANIVWDYIEKNFIRR